MTNNIRRFTLPILAVALGCAVIGCNSRTLRRAARVAGEEAACAALQSALTRANPSRPPMRLAGTSPLRNIGTRARKKVPARIIMERNAKATTPGKENAMAETSSVCGVTGTGRPVRPSL